MRRVTAPIDTTGSAPSEIANLQDALLFLLQTPALMMSDDDSRALRGEVEAERGRREFGPATVRLLGVFQALREMSQMPFVDEASAAILNRELDRLGAFDAAVAGTSIVAGQVRGFDEAPLAGAIVRAFHEEGRAAVRLGEDATDAEGRYTIRYESLAGVPSVQLRVSVTSSDGTPITSSDVVANARSLEVVDLRVPLVTAPPVTRRIEGRVVFEHGMAAEALKLRLYRHEFGAAAPTMLVETATGDEGLYAFSYRADDKSNSLEIRAVDSGGTETALTKVLHGLGDQEITYLNLAVPSSMQPLEPEFTRLAADIVPHVGGVEKLADAREDADRQDFTFLNGATGWDARLLALASTAARVSAEPNVGVSQPVLYGLFRAGLPSDSVQLAHVTSEAVDQALTTAKTAGIIAVTAAEEAATKAAFATMQRTAVLAATVPGTRATYDSLLASAELSDGARNAFVNVYLDHRGTGEELWAKAAAAGVGDAEIKKLQVQGQLTFLTHSEALTTHLQKNVGITDPVQLVDRGFYDADKWKAEAETIAGDAAAKKALLPPAYQTEDVDEGLAAYSADMARTVRISYPTQVVTHQLQQRPEEFGLGEVSAPAATLLRTAAAKGFRLGQTSVDTFVRHNPDILASVDAEARIPAQDAVKKLQRVYQITPSAEAMTSLMKLGFSSALDVVSLPIEVFLERHGRDFPSLEQARLVYRKAQQVSSVTYNLFTIARKLESDPPLYGVSAPAAVRDTVRQELIKQFPTMESLFGSMDYCECEHCRSVLSPAAYLVDLLQFIDADAPTWNSFLSDWTKRHGGEDYTARYMKPYDALVERRPDLPNIALTCENTHTALPYIDIVNEILEYYVAHNALAGQAARDTQDESTADLVAEPQHVVAEAYEKVDKARYPLGLPFDLWLDTVRAFANYFETPLAHVLEVFRPGDELFLPRRPFDRAAAAFERLGLSPSEVAIYTNPSPLAGWFELYGFTSEAEATTAAVDRATGQRVDLNSAKALSRRLGVTYRELVDLLQTTFVNPGIGRLVTLQKMGASVHDVLFYREHKPFFDANKDLLDANRAALPAADQARFDAMSQQQWDRLAEVRGFEERLDQLSARFAASGFDARAWLADELDNRTFDDILVLADPQASVDFDQATLRYAFREDADQRAADGFAFLKINLFVRLWRRLGWTNDETDRALTAFVPGNLSFTPGNLAQAPLRSALIHLARFKALDEQLALGRNSRVRLLAFWAPIATGGRKPLYAQLFLRSGLLRSDPIFDDAFGQYLTPARVEAAVQARTHEVSRPAAPADKIDPAALVGHPRARVVYDELQEIQHLHYDGLLTDADKATLTPLSASTIWPVLLEAVQQGAARLSRVEGHLPALQSALNLSLDDITLILQHAGTPLADAALSLDVVSVLYRHALLAKALQMPVRDVLALIQLSGIDPFMPVHADALENIEQDHLFSQTLRFVAIAGQVKDSGLTAEDLDYLLRHRYDAAGEYQPNPAGTRGVMTSLGSGIDALRADVMVPADPAAVTDDMLRQRLGQALPIDVVDRFLRMLDGSADQAQARVLFDTQLRTPAAGQAGAAGFLDESDFAALFAPLEALVPASSADTPQQAADKEAENAKIEARNAAALLSRRTRVVSAFLPFLEQRLIRQFVVQTLTAHTGAERVLVESLVTDGALLGVNPDAAGTPAPLVHAFARAGERGVTATFRASADGSGDPLGVPFTARDVDTALPHAARPAAAQSVRFDGLVEVPATGTYLFTVAFDRPGQEAELQFSDVPDWRLQGTAAAGALEIGESIELQAGRPYRIAMAIGNLGGGEARLLVQSGVLARGAVERLTLRPATALDGAAGALLRLTKGLQLVQALGLREREIRALLARGARFDGLSLSTLPVIETADGAELFAQFLRLATYVRLRRELAGGGDGILDLLAAGSEDAAYKRLAELTRRDRETVRSVAKVLSIDVPFAGERSLERLADGLAVTGRFGATPGAIVSWLRIVTRGVAAQERADIARDVTAAVKARFEPETWQRVAQPIFDGLRQKKRDALVAHVMHQHGFARVEQLYEYFLIDPGMEPVVQTSRIRLASAAVQLFIQRSLLNLEAKVHPSAVNARHWEWMKAYRVWEANRKIFLYPENWLEPEFRDDKTHLFRELEGSLLQGDVSNDLVEDALLAYLRKLNELARLDIVAMHLEDKVDPASNTLHVIGRTHGEPHKYFYRRYAHQMWTPWEPVTADITGDHVAPVIWRERLFLFWVTFMEVPARNEPPSGGGSRSARVLGVRHASAAFGAAQLGFSEQLQEKESTLTEMSLTDLSRGVQSSVGRMINIQVQLHWSEYARGEWSTRETGGVAASFVASVPFGFSPRSVSIHVSKDVHAEGDRAVYIHLGGPIGRAFKLAGRNSTPVAVAAGALPHNPYSARQVAAAQYAGSGALNVTFNERVTAKDGQPAVPTQAMPTVLQSPESFTVLTCDNDIGFATPEIAVLVKPLFYQDSRHTFYVEPNLEERTIDQVTEWVERTPQRAPGAGIPEPWQPLPYIPPKVAVPFAIDPRSPVWQQPIDRGAIFTVKQRQDWIVNPATAVVFDGQVIGSRGRGALAVMPAADAARAVERGANAVAVTPGAGLPADAAVVVPRDAILQGATIRDAAVAVPVADVNLVGAGGMNQVVVQNVHDMDRSPLRLRLGGVAVRDIVR